MFLIANGKVVCPDRIIDDGAVYIEKNLIAEIGSAADLKRKHPKARLTDAAGGIIMPGLINTHMHFYSTFARGMPLPDFSPGNFVDILEGLWWRLDKKLADEDIYYSALIPIIESIRAGTTTVIDHHASPFAVEGSLDLIAKAVTETGLRASLCYEVSDRDGNEIAKAGISENVRFIREHAGDDLLTGLMGLHASFTIGDKTLEHAIGEARDLGVGCHVHTAEDRADVADANEKYGMGVVERFHARGLLGKKTICAHCVHVSEREIELLAETDTNIVHNPESNMNNAVGCAPVIEMFKGGALVGLGTDGMTSDMFRESKAANIIHKHVSGDPKVGFVESYNMLMENNPLIASKIFPKRFGVIEKGAYADVIVMDYRAPTPVTKDNLAGHLLFGFSAGDVATTIVNGRVLMEKKKLIGIDEDKIAARSRELAARLWKRI